MMRTARDNEQAFRKAGRGMMAFGVAAAAGLALVLTAGAQYQASMNQVRAVSGATGQEFKALSAQARELGASTKFSASEAADGMSFLAMAGFETNEIMSALPGTLQLAAAGNMELAEAADIASNVLTGYQMQAQEISRVNDVMALTFTSTNTNLSQLGEAMKYAAPVASAAGVQFEEASAAIGLMGNAGIQASMAGTSLRTGIVRLLKPTDQVSETMARLGLNVTTSGGELISMTGIVRQLEESGATTADMMEIFGLRAGPAMAALVSQGSDELAGLRGELEESGGTAERIANIQMEGLKGALIELSSAFEGLRIAMFEAGVDEWSEQAVDGITSAIRAMEGLPGPMHTGITAALGLVAVVGTLGGAFLLLLPKIAATQAAMAGMNLTMTGAMLRPMQGIASFMTGPWGAAIAVGAAALAPIIVETGRTRDVVEELRAELDGVPVGMDNLSDAFLLAELRSRDLITVARDLGIGLDDLRKIANGDEEALRRVRLELNMQAGNWDDIRALLPGMRSGYRDMREFVDSFAEGTRQYNVEAQAQHELMQTHVGDLQAMSAGTFGVLSHVQAYIDQTGGAGRQTDLFGNELALAATDAEALGESVEELTASQQRLQDAMGNWRNLGAVHSDVMQSMEKAERDRATEQSQSHNDAIDEEIQALRDRTEAEKEAYLNETVIASDGSRVKRSFYRETADEAVEQMEKERDSRIETLEDQKTSWEQHATDVTVSLTKVAEELEKQNAAYANWEDNLTTVSERAGADVAMALADMGEDGAQLTAAMATATDEEMQRMAAALRTHAARGGDDAVRTLEAKMRAMEEVGKIGGAQTGKGVRDELGKRIPEVARIAEQYSVRVGSALAPLLESIGDPVLAHRIRQYATTGEWRSGLRAGGQVPGQRTHRDTVPAMLTPHEFVQPEGVVDYYGVDFMEAVRQKRIPREALAGYQRGGLVTGDVAGLNQAFLGQLRRWAASQGETYHITSGFRTRAEQAALFAAKPGLAAPPGRSRHESGLASDGPRWGGRNPGAHGLRYPMSYEPWHVEPQNAAEMRGGPGAPGMMPGLAVQIPKPPGYPHMGIARSAPEASRIVHERTQAFADANAFAPARDTGPATASGPVKELAQEMAANRGWGSQWAALDRLVQKESSWNPNAANPTSTARGLFQFLAATRQQYGLPWPASPAQQINAGLQYISDRYGTPRAALDFHNRNNWYGAGGLVEMAHGGVVDSPTVALIGEAGPEAVVPLRGYQGGGYVRVEDRPRLAESLLAAGWRGRDDRMEALYPPPPGADDVTVPPPGYTPPSLSAGRDERWRNAPASYHARRRAGFYDEPPTSDRPPRGLTMPHPGVPSAFMTPEQYERQVERNTRAFEMGLLTLQEHLSNLESRMMRTVPFSDEWMSLFDQRKRLVDEMLDEHIRAVEEATRDEEQAFDRLAGLLDEAQRIRDRIDQAEAQAEEQRERAREQRAEAEQQASSRLFDATESARQAHAEEVERIEERHSEQLETITEQRNDRLAQLEQRGIDERARVIQNRTVELITAFDPQQRVERSWVNSMATVRDNAIDQLSDRRAWAEGLDRLRSMGLSESAINALGLDRLTGESLARVERWSQQTDDEVRALNEAVVANHQWAAERAQTEARRRLGNVGMELNQIGEQIADETARVRADFNTAMTDLERQTQESIEVNNRRRSEALDEAIASYNAAMDQAAEDTQARISEIDAELVKTRTELIGELQLVGYEQGRSHGEAIAEGMRSQIPGVMEAARELQAAQEGRRATEAELSQARETARANPPEGTRGNVAPLGRLYNVRGVGLAVRFSDASWWRAAGSEVPIAERLWGPALSHPTIRADRLEGRLLDRFGMGGIRRYDQPNVQPKYFDRGGPLPPRALSMVYNGLNEAEYVLRRRDGDHAAAAGGTPVPVNVTATMDTSAITTAIDGLASRLEGTTLKAGDTLVLNADGRAITAVVTERQSREGDRFRSQTQHARLNAGRR